LATTARGLRGRDPDQVVAWLQSMPPDGVTAELPGRVGLRPLTRSQARQITAALPVDDDALSRLAGRVIASAKAMGPPAALGEGEVDGILAALSALPREELARQLAARGRTLWNEVFREILPVVAAATRARLFRAATRPVALDAASSVANAVALTFYRRAKDGQFRDYQLESMEDLAAVLIRIGYSKTAARLKKRYMIRLEPLNGDGTRGGFEPPADGDELSSLIHAELIENLRGALAELEATLGPADRLILRCRLDERLPFGEVARRVEAECGGRCSEEKARYRWNVKIIGRLKARLAR
jgi:hypothetical protein